MCDRRRKIFCYGNLCSTSLNLTFIVSSFSLFVRVAAAFKALELCRVYVYQDIAAINAFFSENTSYILGMNENA